jgi:tripartite-type tricarboxylate transporter receptor subunit TctC
VAVKICIVSHSRVAVATVAVAVVIQTANLIGIASAQNFPTRPVTFVAAGPAGGPTDAIGRIVAEGMRPALGQVILIENVAASGGTAVRKVGHADPDGYTIELGHWGTNVVDGAAMSLPFDLLTDFEPIALIASNPILITSRKDLPAGNLQELVAYIKARPGKVTLAEPGAGSPPHVAGIFFENLTGTEIQFVPYRGGGPAMQDLIGGHIDLNMAQAAVSLPQISAGTIKAYGVMAESRMAVVPDVPTTDEAGLPGLHLSVWHALWAPKGTPSDVIAKLNSAVVAALADPAVRQRLAQIGQDVPPRDRQTPEALRKFQKSEIEKWWPIIKGAGIKVD